ncbi:hypothetical protein DFH09DRAFT_1166301 [Mycena vulgaris]|nr:hypothetical protein DFH09DRAFT_1166301 [Mycena vulgaris]
MFHRVLRGTIRLIPTRSFSSNFEHLTALLKQTEKCLKISQNSLETSLDTLAQEREVRKEMKELYKDKLASIEIELLRAQERYNVRGTYEYTLERIAPHVKAHPSSKKQISELMIQNAMFLRLLARESDTRSLRLIDTKMQVLGLYNTLSNSGHGHSGQFDITKELRPTHKLH